MKKPIAAAIGVISIAALVGCSSTDTATPPATEQGDLLVITPAATGELDSASWNLPYGEPASIDPIKAFNYPENTVVANLCEGLMQLQPDFSITPNLAESYSSPDASTYIYKIRQGVTFWDGTPMTMDDVVFSLSRSLNPKEGSYWAGSVTSNISSITQSGDWEVTFTLKAPDSTFNSFMITPLGVVVEKKQREAADADYGTPSGGVMCTGPFSVGDWQQGQSITLERNDNYWNKEHVAKTKSLTINFIVEPAAITSAISTGAIDGSYDVPLGAIPQLKKATNGKLYQGRSLQIVAVISTGEGAFGDPAVRKALMMATDRQAIAATVYEGTAKASTSILPDNGWAYGNDIFTKARKALPGPEVDLAGAKEVLKGAKADLTQPIKIAYPSERGHYADIISEISNAATKLGLTVEPEGVPSAKFGAFFSDPEARAGHDAFMTTNYMSVPDPLAFLRTIAAAGGSQNFSDYSNDEISSLLKEAAAAVEENERAEKMAKVESLLMDDVPWLPIVDPSVQLFMNDRVTGVPASFVYLYYPWASDLGASGK